MRVHISDIIVIHVLDHNYYNYTHLTAPFFQHTRGKPSPERQNHSRFYWSKR